MHIINPSGVKFTNKYLSWFRCLGLGDHGFGGAANEGKKVASNVALPGNSDHNFSKSPAEKQSIPFIRLVVDVQPSRVQKAAHGLHLFEPVGFHPSRFEKLRHRLPGDVLLQNELLWGIHRQKPGHGDTEFPQRFIIVQLGLQLVTKGVVFARLVMDLFQDILRCSICHQIGVAAFSFPKKLEYGIFRIVYRQCIRHRSISGPYPQRPCPHGEQALFVPALRHSGKSSPRGSGQCRS